MIRTIYNLLKTKPNYLLGVEHNDPYAETVLSLLAKIKDEKIRDLLLAQIEAAVRIGE
ncbi:MAG: hypothetical protein IJ703_01795 [Eubacterium sp.]|nr:hypothetical protein [Eubacterium sp.]